jgi:hypothetical protein
MNLRAYAQTITYTVGFYLRSIGIMVTDVRHKRTRLLPGLFSHS